MNPNLIVFVLVAHFIGEFICQDGSMIAQKSKHMAWLVLHAMIYTIVIFFICLLGILLFDNLTARIVAGFALTNGVFHFAIDSVMSEINESNKEKKKNHLFWIGTGWTQLLYVTILIYSLYILS
jgi:hypothetical protein